MDLSRVWMAVGAAWRRMASASTDADWSSQFSEASLDDRRGRRRVDALYRAATVRL